LNPTIQENFLTLLKLVGSNANMIKIIKLWIDEYVIYRSKTEQKTTLSSMNKLYEMSVSK